MLNSQTRLTAEEFASLFEIGLGFMQRPIPPAHRDRLFFLGLTRQGLGGLRLTSSGARLLRFEAALRAGYVHEGNVVERY